MGHPGKLFIKQQFSGIDEHGHLTIDTELEGRVPQIAFGSSVHIEPYTELYHYSHQGEPQRRVPGQRHIPGQRRVPGQRHPQAPALSSCYLLAFGEGSAGGTLYKSPFL